MARKNKVIFSIVVAAILSILFLTLSTPVNRQTIPTRFIIGENMGFDLGPGNINFGLMVPGSKTSRDITITNTDQYPTITTIKASGAISEYIIVSENKVRLNPNESKNLTFTAYPSETLELGEYPGQIEIISKKA